MQKIVENHVGIKLPPDPPVAPVFVPFSHHPTHSFSLWDDLHGICDRVVSLKGGAAEFAEMFDQFYGYTIYEFDLKSHGSNLVQVTIPSFADRAIVFSGTNRIAFFPSGLSSAVIENVSPSSPFRVLTENLGRINFWHEFPDERKGFFFPFFFFCVVDVVDFFVKG
jgi:hypothetical protein